MEVRLRTTRTLKVTDVRVSDQEREHLAQLYQDARYESLLNCMERACIEIETAHLNTSVNEPEAVLGGHILAKATWLFFQYVQKQVKSSHDMQLVEEHPEEEPSLEDVLQGVEGIP
jgi:hypothetical protein